MGERVSDIFSLYCSGKCFCKRWIKAGQQEVVIFFPSFLASDHSSASYAAVISPPRPTSTMSLKPSFFNAVRMAAMEISLPNCPSVAGAHMAKTSLSD